MKILNLKFKNINSLSGVNEIDFTQPVFTNDGLFAITGKTGSGKSSILDAISLALYGRTPRVDITGSENAVMTRGEKDCFAEITFEVAGKKWKSSWKQERARTGTLKPVNRIIAEYDGQIIADQVRSCDNEIVKILGLTFEQFTKVIMLAQGSFAAFLQADKNDKGQLLEQITGTEIYADISRAVFERNRAEKEKLDKILLELETINVLTEEEIEKLKKHIAELEIEKNQIDNELKKIETAKKWLSDLENLQKQIADTKNRMPELEERKRKTQEAFEISEKNFTTAKNERTRLEPIFNKVREIDTKIDEKDKLLHPIVKTISELEESIKQLSNQLEQQNAELEIAKRTFDEKQNWATENKKYEDLVANYSAIEKENQLLVDSSNEQKNLHTEIDSLQRNLDVKVAEATKASEAFNVKQKDLNDKTKELEAYKKQIAECLGGKELSSLQSEKETLSDFGVHIKNLIEIEGIISASKNEIELLLAKIKQSEESTCEISKSIERDKEIIVSLENNINLIYENIKLAKTIQSLEEHRLNLKDGEECPLCGALEHPFARGNVPKIGDKEIELATLKKQHQQLSNKLHENKTRLATLETENKSDLNNLEKERKTLSIGSDEQTAIMSELKSLYSAFSIPQGESKIKALEDILTKKNHELSSINTVLTKATTIEAKISFLRDKDIPELQDETQYAERIKTGTITAQKIEEQNIANKWEAQNKIKLKHNEQSNALLKKFKEYSVENIDELKKCLDSWVENKKHTDNLTSEIQAINTHIALKQNQLGNQNGLYSAKQEEKQNIENEKQNLVNERILLFGDKSVDQEEKRLKKLIEDYESAKSKAEKEKNDTNTEFEKISAVVKEKEAEWIQMNELNITEKTADELQEDFNIMRNESDDISQKIGANKQSLNTNEENLKSSKSKLKEKEKQQDIFNKWGKLNELIGSSDGKKYRNFAQALTFEHLVSLSNFQLFKMSDRYLLKRTGDTANPFELSVIDKFQNSDERTVQNLSGGEKFIISLSLALGLASMASKNMRIDTMFIDEGFGTLDSEYLDVALNALSNLQSDGKVIGIISHIAELKERIATHIEVVPIGNGYSKIQITN